MSSHHINFLFTELKWTGKTPEVIPIEGIHPQQGQTTTPGAPFPALKLFEQSVGSFTSRRIVNNEELRDGAYGLSSLSEKTRVSNQLQMKLQMQHFLLRYLKNRECCSVEDQKPTTSRTVVRSSTNWGNRSAVSLRWYKIDTRYPVQDI